MLFQGDYWFASLESERLETIQHFLEQDEKINTLVIVQKNYESWEIVSILNRISYLYDFNVNLITESGGTQLYNGRDNSVNIKTIYLRESIDDETINLIKNKKPVISIFI
jgi:hypothetical protein